MPADPCYRTVDWLRRRAAERTRLCRQRQRAGIAVLRIAVRLGPTAEILNEAGFLKEWDMENPAEIARALERMLARAPEMAGEV